MGGGGWYYVPKVRGIYSDGYGEAGAGEICKCGGRGGSRHTVASAAADLSVENGRSRRGVLSRIRGW